MKISGITNNCNFKSLHFGPTTEEHRKKILMPNIMKLNNIAKNADVFISSEQFLMVKGSDYQVTAPTLKVTVSPIRDVMTREPQKPKTSKILEMSYTYRPDNSKDAGDDFVSYVEGAVETITK